MCPSDKRERAGLQHQRRDHTVREWLRRQLEPPGVAPGTVVIADRTHVRLNPDAVVCDAVEFEQTLAEARRATSRRNICEGSPHSVVCKDVREFIARHPEDKDLARRAQLL